MTPSPPSPTVRSGSLPVSSATWSVSSDLGARAGSSDDRLPSAAVPGPLAGGRAVPCGGRFGRRSPRRLRAVRGLPSAVAPPPLLVLGEGAERGLTVVHRRRRRVAQLGGGLR